MQSKHVNRVKNLAKNRDENTPLGCFVAINHE